MNGRPVYKITPKGIEANEGFRQRLHKWLDGVEAHFGIAETREGVVLDMFTRAGDTGMTPREAADKSDEMSLYAVQDTMTLLLRRQLIEKVK